MSKYTIINDFISYMNDKYNKTYTDSQIHNFEILYETLEKKSKIPTIVPIPMGEGKSAFIEYYCKYKYDKDPNFSAVIVKRTIAEADEFCMNISNNIIDDIDYLGLINKQYGDYSIFPSYERLKAYTLKGFNFKDCVKYKNKSSKKADEVHLITTDYDSRLCANCNYNCPIKKLKYHIEQFRIIAITHNRLFWSNNVSDILDRVIKYVEDKPTDDIFTYQKIQHKRRLLIIDEKISMIYRNTLRLEDLNKLKNYINNYGTTEDKELIAKYESAIKEIEFSNTVNETKILENTIKENNTFSKELTNHIFLQLDSQNLEKSIAFLENVSSFKEIFTFKISCKSDEDGRVIGVTKYLDLSNYAKHFENTVITDATAIEDLEYSKSNAVILKDITQIKKPINLYLPINHTSMSKLAIRSNYQDITEKMGKECMNIIEQNDNSKSLILTHKWVYNLDDNFISDIQKNIKCEENSYKIIYFGQYTTGVNFLSEYQNIIILGQFRKGAFYEESKRYVFDNKYDKEKLILNEILIDTVQQIGRTSLRKGVTPNVYLFANETVINHLKNNLDKFFEINLYEYDNDILFKERKKYNDGKVRKDTYYFKFLKFIAEEKQKTNEKIKTYDLEEIKESINYNGKDYKRDFLKKAKDFVFYDKKSKSIVIDFEKAVEELKGNGLI